MPIKKGTKRNWGKFILSGIEGNMKYLLASKQEVLTELEIERINQVKERVEGLLENWDVGTEKLSKGG